MLRYSVSQVLQGLRQSQVGVERNRAVHTSDDLAKVAMPLPNELLQAISSPGGGQVALILGAGCSVEAPTSIPVARTISLEIHRRLVGDGVLQDGDCANPEDLSHLADAVFARTNSQREVVERFLAQYNLKLAAANEGYHIAAAMLSEGAISSVVTLNFDLGLSAALADLGVGPIVGLIESPEHLPRQRAVNIYYLHRNANAAPELWVLRTGRLQVDWTQWEPIIATRVLTAPVVVFAGLGTPVAVILESSQLILEALPNARSVYQVDPADQADSQFSQESGLDAAHYIRLEWGEFMDQLSQRLIAEHLHQLEQAINRKVGEEGLMNEDVGNLLIQLRVVGLVKQGMLRSDWVLHDMRYRKVDPDVINLIADLFLALGLMMRVSGTVAAIVEDGIIEFHRDERTVAAYILASGRGHRSTSAVEADVDHRRRRYAKHLRAPRGIIVGGTSNAVIQAPTPPADIRLGDVSVDNLIGPIGMPMYHISELRANPARVEEMLP